MADRALGALAAAFGSAAVEGRLLRAGVIIRKGPHRDGAPETHRHPGPDRTSWARTIAICTSDALPAQPGRRCVDERTAEDRMSH